MKSAAYFALQIYLPFAVAGFLAALFTRMAKGRVDRVRAMGWVFFTAFAVSNFLYVLLSRALPSGVVTWQGQHWVFSYLPVSIVVSLIFAAGAYRVLERTR